MALWLGGGTLLILTLFVDLLKRLHGQPRLTFSGAFSHARPHAVLFLNRKDLELRILNHGLCHSLGTIVVVFGILEWWRGELGP